jgi:molybdopterin-containing oxidoreductase family membrane subunit
LVSFFVLFLCKLSGLSQTAQAEIKTMEGTGDNYIRERAANKDIHHE